MTGCRLPRGLWYRHQTRLVKLLPGHHLVRESMSAAANPKHSLAPSLFNIILIPARLIMYGWTIHCRFKGGTVLGVRFRSNQPCELELPS